MTWPAWSVLGPALGGVLGAVLLGASIAVAPYAMRALHLSLEGLALFLVGGYLLAAAGGTALGALLGRRRPAPVAVPAAALMLVGVVLTGLTTGSAPVLLVGQWLAGLGGGVSAGTAAGLLLGVERWRDRAAVLVVVVAAAGAVLGFAASWGLAVFLSWRLIFFVAMPVPLVAGAITLVGGIARLASPPTRHTR